MSVRGDILVAIGERLSKITADNGYTTDVKKVYFNKIPMGLDLQPHEIPSIFLLDRVDILNTQQAVIEGQWEFDLQLWNNEVEDTTMLQFVRDVYKALYADSPTVQMNGAFRSIHPQVVEIIPLSISSDLHMIEANRVTVVTFKVRYRTKLFDM